MRGILIHCLLATACAAGLAACGGDDDDGGEVSNAGKGGSSVAGTGGSGESGSGSIACTAATDCPGATTQTQDGPEACCTVAADLPPPMGAYATSRTVGVCGLHFTDPARLPCFERAAPGEIDDECPQMLDQGWGANPGCCHAAFSVCGIINSETGCTLYRPTAKKPDGTEIGGMGSGSFMCTPGE